MRELETKRRAPGGETAFNSIYSAKSSAIFEALCVFSVFSVVRTHCNAMAALVLYLKMNDDLCFSFASRSALQALSLILGAKVSLHHPASIQIPLHGNNKRPGGPGRYCGMRPCCKVLK